MQKYKKKIWIAKRKNTEFVFAIAYRCLSARHCFFFKFWIWKERAPSHCPGLLGMWKYSWIHGNLNWFFFEILREFHQLHNYWSRKINIKFINTQMQKWNREVEWMNELVYFGFYQMRIDLQIDIASLRKCNFYFSDFIKFVLIAR